MKFCTNCGDTINETMSFCENCGVKLPSLQERADSPSVTNQARGDERADKDEFTYKEAPIKTVNTEQHIDKQATSAHKKSPVILAVIAANVVLVVGIIIAVIMLAPSPEKDLQKVYSYYSEGDKEKFMAAFDMPKGTIGEAEHFYNEASYYDWDVVYEELHAALANGETELSYIDTYYGNPIYEVTVEPVLFIFKRAVFTYYPATIDVQFEEGQSLLTFGNRDIANQRNNSAHTYPIIPATYDYSTMLDGVTYEDSFEVVREATNYFSLNLDEPIQDEEVVMEEVPAESTTEHNQELVDESDRAFIVELYENFRYEYAEAIHYLEPERIERFIGNAQLYEEYKKFIEDHASIAGYHYRFYENDITEIVPLGNGQFEVYTLESFDFTSNEDGTYYYEREKRYTIDSDERHYVIVNIETLHTDKRQQ